MEAGEPLEDVVLYLVTEEDSGHSFQRFLDTLVPKLNPPLLWLTPHERRVCKLMVHVSPASDFVA